ncbi:MULTISPECIES: hypothetical protein [Clostridium]|uniref:Uncharacterized protein n=1 Tax=Clostridium ragsdalei P11 TaxID=1353534 RepID=A0A1A6AP41_9CLOT|nr:MULTISPECIES: hypothetical protein [Clostridium]OBR91836.1 hypothetical protein CLRAG_28200 [Clostridium ragsdalei P11]QXE19494.1 hypothetical protein B5S50_12065 [Clostridium sp. 001]
MLLWNEACLINERKKISENIVKWSGTKDTFLNCISVPYNSTEIFLEVIEKYIRQNKNIVYITNEKMGNVDIIKDIKKYTHFTDYAYVKGCKSNLNCKLQICNFENAAKLEKKFELIIYDDISSFSLYNKYEICKLISKLTHEDSKVIIYSIESIVENSKKIFLPAKNEGLIIEPRNILTRLNMNKEMPFLVYDYLKWSISIGKKIIIYVPSECKIEKVASYMHKYCRSLAQDVVCFANGETNKKLIYKFLQAKNSILITNCFEETVLNAKNSELIVYFADDINFTYKEFVYLCGSVGRGEKNLKEEVILVSNIETEEIEKAKSITSNFNREAWNMGLLKI